MNKLLKSVFFWSALSITASLIGQVQQEEGKDFLRNGTVNVFMDCHCDLNFIRQEIPYVNYVRDVREAQIYVLVTNQQTAGGGNSYTFSFQGLDNFSGMNDTLVYTSYPGEMNSVVREGQVRVLKLGLLRYLAHTPLREGITIIHSDSLNAETKEESADKWNNWVFELQTSPRFRAEETYRTLNLFNSVRVTKITPEIKFELDFDHSLNKQQYIEDEEENTYIRKSESADMLLVKSLGEHWSAGLRWGLRGSTEANYDLKQELMPAIEYDLFPYSQATHRQLRILYSTGYEYDNYIDTSIYNLTSEHRFRQELGLAYQVQEKWGSVNVSISGSNYLHDFSKNSVEIEGYVRIRLLKGLSVSLNGDAGYINDRLNQRKEELTEAERLLRLKQQATSFEVGASLSINFTFGSIYNNVVNPRFNRY